MTDLAATLLSYVVTCKGRLEHLRQTLPRLTAQPDAECVVVDYDCPDGTAEWARANCPTAKIVKVEHAALFHLSRARNLGARAATREWIAFLDADVLIEPGFTNSLAGILRYGSYFRPLPITRETSGSFVCHRGDFFALNGYDETLEGYGGEDNDLYFRLNHFGRSCASFDGRLLSSLPHDDKLRSAFYEIRGIEINRLINSLYNHIKYDLMRVSGQNGLPVEMRRAIYVEIRRTLVESWQLGEFSGRINITLPIRHEIPVPNGWAIKRRWTFDIEQIAQSSVQTP